MAAPQVEVNCDAAIDSPSEIVSRNVNIVAGYLVEGDGAAGAAGVRHAAAAPAVLVVRAAADHVHVHRQVIQLVPAALCDSLRRVGLANPPTYILGYVSHHRKYIRRQIYLNYLYIISICC